jgi:uncharacterized membrane protein YfcA
VREQNARRFMAIASTLAVLGVALNLSSDDSTLAKLIAAAGIITLVWSIHRFGRLGPDEPIVFETPEDAAPKKKKKKKKRAAKSDAGSTEPPSPSEADQS